MTTKSITFAAMEKIDVTSHVEKKGKFSYLSWPYAVSEFRKACPSGYWRITGADTGVPYTKDPSGAYVCVTVYTSPDCPGFTQVHPVLNHQNKPITSPSSFDVNTSIQRGLVKAIAIATGIGLHIYAGEDLPPVEPVAPPTQEQIAGELADKLMGALIGADNTRFLDSIWVDPNFIAELHKLPLDKQQAVEACYNTKKSQLTEVPA